MLMLARCDRDHIERVAPEDGDGDDAVAVQVERVHVAARLDFDDDVQEHSDHEAAMTFVVVGVRRRAVDGGRTEQEGPGPRVTHDDRVGVDVVR